MRIGYGWDSHEFKSGVPLMIGGVKLPHSKGLAGHSDIPRGWRDIRMAMFYCTRSPMRC